MYKNDVEPRMTRIYADDGGWRYARETTDEREPRKTRKRDDGPGDKGHQNIYRRQRNSKHDNQLAKAPQGRDSKARGASAPGE